MKFKVGDKVRARDDLVVGRKYGSLTWWNCMDCELKGKSLEISGVNTTCNGYIYYRVGSYSVAPEMLEPVTDKEETPMEKIVIYRKDNQVIAKYYKGGKTVQAEATCSQNDTFDFETGANMAMDRAMALMKEEEIGYSWVKCVGYRQKDEFYFTVNKKYKIYDNGKITTDMGHTYTNKTTKEEMLQFLSRWYIFEECEE